MEKPIAVVQALRLPVQRFVTARDAKEFLASRIVTESQRKSIPLSDIETKMLYFSETAWTLPDTVEVSAAFDRDYDQAEYEEKIGTLVRNFYSRVQNSDTAELVAWKEAVRILSREDHYLLVLIAGTKQPKSMSSTRLLKLSAIAFAGACVLLVMAFLYINR